jgi:hypothetical protein
MYVRMYVFLFIPVLSTYPTNLALILLITRMKVGEE